MEKIKIKDTEFLVQDEKEPLAMFGVETGPGWHPVIKKVLDKISQYNQDSPEDSRIFVDQVKEKFGTLRIYVTYDNVPKETIEDIDAAISEAENEARDICEFCGAKENVGVRIKGWYTTMCESCAKKEVKKEGLFYKDGITWKRNSDGKVFLITDKETKEL